MSSRYSGKFVLRMSPSLHNDLKMESSSLGLSLNEYCLKLISNGRGKKIENAMGIYATLLLKQLGDSLLGIVLFGSKARNDTHDHSDIDLLVVLEDRIQISRDLYRKLPKEISQDVSLHFTHLPDTIDSAGSIFLECAIEGIVLYDKNRLISKRLNELKTYILSGKAIRRETHGQGFWIHV